MSFLFDYFPIICFFIAYKIGGVYWATLAAMAASALQVSFFWLRHHKIERLHLITLILILILGSMTLIFHKPIFIQWKPSVIYWLFAAALIGSHFVGTKKSLLAVMLASKITLPDAIWKRLSYSWAYFFIAMGIANIIVAYHYSLDTWVYFKLFGTLGLTLLFAIAQSLYLYRFIKPNTDKS